MPSRNELALLSLRTENAGIVERIFQVTNVYVFY
jgi:hypothetical protein